MGDPVTTTLAVVSVFSAYKSYEAGKESASLQREAAGREQEARNKQIQQQELQANRQRQQAMREKSIRQARVRALSELGGSATSTGAEGAVASIGTQTAGNISFLNQYTGLSREANVFLQFAAEKRGEAAKATSTATTWGAVSSLTSSMTDWKAVGGKINTIFDTQPVTNTSPIPAYRAQPAYDPSKYTFR